MRMEPRTDHSITRLCILLTPLALSDEKIDLIAQEWKMYRQDKSIQMNWYMEEKMIGDKSVEIKYRRIDEYWGKVLVLVCNTTGRKKYEHLAEVVKCGLTISHGNSDPERGFSINNSILSKDRPQLSEKTIVALRTIKDNVQRCGGIGNILITGKLVSAVRQAHKKYLEEKEMIKKAAEESKRNKILLVEEKIKSDTCKQIKMELEKQKVDLDKKIRELQEEAATSRIVISEGNDRLQHGIKRKDFKEIRIASSLIEGGTTKLETVLKQLLEKENTRKKLKT